jgi:hypothetical protein
MLVYIGESTGPVELRPQRCPGSATVHDLLPGLHKGCEKLRRNNLVILCVPTASDGYVESPRCRSSPYDASRVSVSMTPGSFESMANPDPRCSMAHCPVDREFSNLRPENGQPWRRAAVNHQHLCRLDRGAFFTESSSAAGSYHHCLGTGS